MDLRFGIGEALNGGKPRRVPAQVSDVPLDQVHLQVSLPLTSRH
jgi:hypothetical protein